MTGIAETTSLDVNTFWTWYWVNKAALSGPGPFGHDELVSLWNSVMAYDLVRGMVVPLVALWFAASVMDSIIGLLFDRPERTPAVKYSPPAEMAELQALTVSELKQRLEKLGKTQAQLATELGVNRSYVSHLLRGKKPFTPELRKRCREILDRWQGGDHGD